MALLGLNLATPLAAIAPRFARPLVKRAQELDGLAPVTDGDWDKVRLLGVRVEPEIANPGERVDVTLYWEASAAPSTELRAIVRLRGVGGRLLAQCPKGFALISAGVNQVFGYRAKNTHSNNKHREGADWDDGATDDITNFAHD